MKPIALQGIKKRLKEQGIAFRERDTRVEWQDHVKPGQCIIGSAPRISAKVCIIDDQVCLQDETERSVHARSASNIVPGGLLWNSIARWNNAMKRDEYSKASRPFAFNEWEIAHNPALKKPGNYVCTSESAPEKCSAKCVFPGIGTVNVPIMALQWLDFDTQPAKPKKRARPKQTKPKERAPKRRTYNHKQNVDIWAFSGYGKLNEVVCFVCNERQIHLHNHGHHKSHIIPFHALKPHEDHIYMVIATCSGCNGDMGSAKNALIGLWEKHNIDGVYRICTRIKRVMEDNEKGRKGRCVQTPFLTWVKDTFHTPYAKRGMGLDNIFFWMALQSKHAEHQDEACAALQQAYNDKMQQLTKRLKQQQHALQAVRIRSFGHMQDIIAHVQDPALQTKRLK